jgi:uncharacterized membrane protein YGL010W
MKAQFRQQMAMYAEYHRDSRNCATHYVGIPMLFLAAILPLALWPFTILGMKTTAATLLVAPAVLGWMLLDVGVGLAMLAAIVPLVLAAEAIGRHASTTTVWSIAVALFAVGWAFQIVGHAVFERRRPALFDNLVQMLIGPMFVTAKVLVGLGWRSDLAPLIQAGSVPIEATRSAGPRRPPEGIRLLP